MLHVAIKGKEIVSVVVALMLSVWYNVSIHIVLALYTQDTIILTPEAGSDFHTDSSKFSKHTAMTYRRIL